MRRGELWWAELPALGGRRPVLLLSRDEAYALRELVMVAPVTTRIRAIPTELVLGKEEGLPKRCVANLDSVATIPKSALRERVAMLASVKLAAMERALRFAFGLSES